MSRVQLCAVVYSLESGPNPPHLDLIHELTKSQRKLNET